MGAAKKIQVARRSRAEKEKHKKAKPKETLNETKETLNSSQEALNEDDWDDEDPIHKMKRLKSAKEKYDKDQAEDRMQEDAATTIQVALKKKGEKDKDKKA